MMVPPETTRLLPVLAICLAASLPYVSSANNYFVNDDFGVVQLLSQKPQLYFPRRLGRNGNPRRWWCSAGTLGLRLTRR
jgi:hypothetical protein